MKQPPGIILYDGPSLLDGSPILCIATFRTRNSKIGNMIQTWILPRDRNPLEAVQTNSNYGVCGNCPLQGKGTGLDRKTKNRICYVNLGQAPNSIFKSYQKGNYPRFDKRLHAQYLRSRKIRIGSYGDPAALPVPLVRYLAETSCGWTGYSHQLFWINRNRAESLAKYLMVSCHTPAMRVEAKRKGWRSFSVTKDHEQANDALLCPHTSHRITCDQCGLCSGTSSGARDIYVLAHAKVGQNLHIVQ